MTDTLTLNIPAPEIFNKENILIPRRCQLYLAPAPMKYLKTDAHSKNKIKERKRKYPY
jgi:hypothetical protein